MGITKRELYSLIVNLVSNSLDWIVYDDVHFPLCIDFFYMRRKSFKCTGDNGHTYRSPCWLQFLSWNNINEEVKLVKLGNCCGNIIALKQMINR